MDTYNGSTVLKMPDPRPESASGWIRYFENPDIFDEEMDLGPDTTVVILGVYGYHEAVVSRDGRTAKDNVGMTWFLKWDESDRHAWTCIGGCDPSVVGRLELHRE